MFFKIILFTGLTSVKSFQLSVYKLVNLHVPGWKSVGQAPLIEYINKRLYRYRSQNDNFSKCFHHMNENHMELF